MLSSSKIISLLKESLRLSNRDIAALISSSEMKVSRLEKGAEAKLSIENFYHICKHLGIDLEAFFTGAIINYKNLAKTNMVEVKLNQSQAELIGNIQSFPDSMKESFYSFMSHVQPKMVDENVDSE